MANDDSLFGQTYTQIITNALNGAGNFQMVYPYIDWWWPTAPNGQIAPQALSLVNSVPQWSAIGQFAPGSSSLFNAYGQVLQHVNPTIPPDQQQAFTNAHNNLIAAQNQWQNDQTAMYRAWTVASSNLPPGVPAPDYASWSVSSGWAATLQTDNLQIAKAQQVQAQVTGQQSPQLTQALQAATLPSNATSVVPGYSTMNQGDGTLVPVPAFNIGTSGQDWVALLSQGGGNQISINLSQSASSYDYSKSWAGGNASFNRIFWAVNVGGSWQQWNVNQSDQSVAATIKFTATQVQVMPGQWYNGGYLRSLAETPGSFFAPWTPTGGTSPVFGQGGLLPLQIAGLVAAYQPSFSITMSQNSFSQAVQQFNASSGIRIGPFSFGGSGGHESNTVKMSASGSTFTGQSTATYPFIIGVLVAKPGLS